MAEFFLKMVDFFLQAQIFRMRKNPSPIDSTRRVTSIPHTFRGRTMFFFWPDSDWTRIWSISAGLRVGFLTNPGPSPAQNYLAQKRTENHVNYLNKLNFKYEEIIILDAFQNIVKIKREISMVLNTVLILLLAYSIILTDGDLQKHSEND